MISAFEQYKRKAMAAARDFKYGKPVEEAIYAAKTSDEISVIMRNARIKKFHMEDDAGETNSATWIYRSNTFSSGHHPACSYGLLTVRKFQKRGVYDVWNQFISLPDGRGI